MPLQFSKHSSAVATLTFGEGLESPNQDGGTMSRETSDVFAYSSDYLAVCIITTMVGILSAIATIVSLAQSRPISLILVMVLMSLLFLTWGVCRITIYVSTKVEILGGTLIVSTWKRKQVINLSEVEYMDYGSRSIALRFPKIFMDPIIRVYAGNLVIDISPLLVDATAKRRVGCALVSALEPDQLSDGIRNDPSIVAEASPLPRPRLLKKSSIDRGR
jgi:hypothetical protein